jgi:hypothetical protein
MPQFWPNQPWIAFGVFPPGSDGPNLGRLAIVDQNGTGYAVLDQAWLLSAPALAPRGEPIAYYIALNAAGSAREVKSVDVATKVISLIDTGGQTLNNPVFAADRNQLHWIVEDNARGILSHVLIQDLESGRQVTSTSEPLELIPGGPVLWPSPNGAWIAQPSALQDLYLHRAAGGRAIWNGVANGNRWSEMRIFWRPDSMHLLSQYAYSWSQFSRSTFFTVMDFAAQHRFFMRIDGDPVDMLAWINPPQGTNSVRPQSVTANGVTFELLSARTTPNGVDVSVCYSLPEGSTSWALGNSPSAQAKLVVGGQLLLGDGWSFLNFRNDAAGNPTHRCDALHFNGAAPASLTGSTLTLQTLEHDIPEQLECPPLQAQLDAKQTGIVIKCHTEPGVGSFEIDQAPPGMSQEDAFKTVNQLITRPITGPWTFTL